MRLILVIALILAVLTIIAFILVAVFTLYLPEYEPGESIFLARDMHGKEIIEIYSLMVEHTQATGAYNEYRSYFSGSGPDGWAPAAYKKASDLVGQLRSNDGPDIHYAAVTFTTFGHGQSRLELAVDSHGDHLIYLVYAPGNSNDNLVQLDAAEGWFYRDFCNE